MKFGNVEIKGKQFAVEVDSNGKFETEFESTSYSYPSLEALREGIAKKMARTGLKLDIPFVMDHEGKAMRGVITGVHSSNRNILVRWDEAPKFGTKTEQISPWQEFVKGEVAEEFIKLSDAARKARKELNDFIRQHKLNVKEAIQKAAQSAGDAGAAGVDVGVAS